MTDAAQFPGVVQIRSQHSVAATLDRLQTLLNEHGIPVFARVDFSADAAHSGLSMRAEQLLLFGNPKAGTPLMQAVSVAGLDLPLRLLVWEAADGQVWAAYNDPGYIGQRYSLPAVLVANLSAVLPLIQRAVGD